MTDQCHAATALLTREYQIDSSSPILTPTASRATTSECLLRFPPKSSLDNSFHIRTTASTTPKLRRADRRRLMSPAIATTR